MRAALAGLGERPLLVWDNAEDVWDDADVRQFVENSSPNCQSLITTRLDPERTAWPIIELRRLGDDAMEDLFLRLAASARLKVGTKEDLDAIPRIIDWLGGHPLAMILVVPLFRRYPIKRVWADLQSRPLKGNDAAFELSYERLTGDQRQLFGRLSVYTIPVERSAAYALLPDVEGDPLDEMLDTLVGRALLGFDGARLAYHSLLRQYA